MTRNKDREGRNKAGNKGIKANKGRIRIYQLQKRR